MVEDSCVLYCGTHLCPIWGTETAMITSCNQLMCKPGLKPPLVLETEVIAVCWFNYNIL